jgi:cell division septum initiation protein DivIVA
MTQYSPEDLMAVLADLSNLLEEAKPVLLSKDIRVNREGALGLVGELRSAMPFAIKHASEALLDAKAKQTAAGERADQVLSQAKADAEAIVKKAKAEADSIVAAARQRQIELGEREAIVAQANLRATEIVTAAQSESARLAHGADTYCDSQLASFANSLSALQGQISTVQQQVSAGRAQLAESLAKSTPSS